MENIICERKIKALDATLIHNVKQLPYFPFFGNNVKKIKRF
jgi:hypothetical protein